MLRAHPNLTNAFFTGGVTFKENPDPKAIQPIWAGASYWKFTQPPTSSDSLYEGYGAIFLDDRLDNVNSPQLVLYYTKDSDQHVPFLYWNWEAGPGTTHLWPASWYVTWGGFRFVRQNDTGKVFLEGSGSDSRFRRAAEYNTFSDAWAMRSWNCKSTHIAIERVLCGLGILLNRWQQRTPACRFRRIGNLSILR